MTEQDQTKAMRIATLEQWAAEARVVLHYNNASARLRAPIWYARVGKLTFADPSPEHLCPSELFFAQVALAVHAGDAGQQRRDCGNLACDGPKNGCIMCPDREWDK